MADFYGADLSHIHHVGFGDFAIRSADGLLGVLREAGFHSGLVVDLGCGSGLLARQLIEAGYDVVGVDISPAMLAIAAATAPGARFVRASVYEFVFPPCVGITAIGEVLCYLATEAAEADLAPLFQRVYQALRPDGLFIFDVLLRSEWEPMRYRASREGEGWRVDVEVVEDPDRSLLTRRISTIREWEGGPRRSQEEHLVRTFSADELEQLLQSSGFEVRRQDHYGGVPLPPQRMAFIATKRGSA